MAALCCLAMGRREVGTLIYGIYGNIECSAMDICTTKQT
jgi:hypothetical protein